MIHLPKGDTYQREIHLPKGDREIHFSKGDRE